MSEDLGEMRLRVLQERLRIVVLHQPPRVQHHNLFVESGPLRAVHLSRHKWPKGLVN